MASRTDRSSRVMISLIRPYRTAQASAINPGFTMVPFPLAGTPVCPHRERQQENTVADVSAYVVPLDDGFAEPELLAEGVGGPRLVEPCGRIPLVFPRGGAVFPLLVLPRPRRDLVPDLP